MTDPATSSVLLQLGVGGIFAILIIDRFVAFAKSRSNNRNGKSSQSCVNHPDVKKAFLEMHDVKGATYEEKGFIKDATAAHQTQIAYLKSIDLANRQTASEAAKQTGLLEKITEKIR